MDKHVLVIAATAFVAWGASTAGAQDYPDYATREQPQVVQQRQELERQLERAQSPRRIQRHIHQPLHRLRNPFPGQLAGELRIVTL
jgi:hypothetical protein